MGFTAICRIFEKMQLAGIQDYRRSFCRLRFTFCFNGDVRMTLLELLVQELPKRGGWPEGVNCISTHADGMVFHDGSIQSYRFNEFCLDGWKPGKEHGYTNAVSKNQYEAALAASEQPEWNGDGLPPVGQAIEYSCIFFNPNRPAIEQGKWYKGTIIAYYDECVWTSDNGIRPLDNTQFRPIRTEAERKREEAKNAIAELCRSSASNGHSADLIYDAIAAGEIAGLKLAD